MNYKYYSNGKLQRKGELDHFENAPLGRENRDKLRINNEGEITWWVWRNDKWEACIDMGYFDLFIVAHTVYQVEDADGNCIRQFEDIGEARTFCANQKSNC